MVFVRRVKIYPVAHVGIDSAVGGPIMVIEQLLHDIEQLRARFLCELTMLSSFGTLLDILHVFAVSLKYAYSQSPKTYQSAEEHDQT